MSTLLAVDPGIRGCGAALFDGSRLVAAAYVKNPITSGNRANEAAAVGHAVALWVHETHYWRVIDFVVVEWPQIYASRIRAGRTKEDPNDLLALAGVVSVVAAEVGNDTDAASYAPAEWKGQVPKEVMCARIVARLDEAERAIVEAVLPASKRHNAIDAVGLGLRHLGRLERKRAA